MRVGEHELDLPRALSGPGLAGGVGKVAARIPAPGDTAAGRGRAALLWSMTRRFLAAR